MRKLRGFAVCMLLTAAAGVMLQLVSSGVLRIPPDLDVAMPAIGVGVAVVLMSAYLIAVVDDRDLVFRHSGTVQARDVLARGITADLGLADRVPVSAPPEMARWAGTGTLVILGPPGSGKSALARDCARKLLANRGDGPVAVPLSLARWSPVHSSLTAWLAEELVATYPALARYHVSHIRGRRTPRDNRTAAARLLGEGAVVPVLDDFDRLPLGRRQALLAELSTLKMPVVVVSREAEFAASTKAGSMSDMTVVELSPTTLVHEVVGSDGTVPPRWWALVKAARDSPRGTLLLGQENVELLQRAYRAAASTPAELLDEDRFPDVLARQAHLAELLVETPRLRKTLRFLAGELRRLGERDIAWWRLHRMVPKFVQAVVAAGCSVVAGVSAAAVVTIPVSMVTKSLFGLLIGLGVLLALMVPVAKPAPVRLGMSRGRWRRWELGGVVIGVLGAAILVTQKAQQVDVVWFVVACIGAGLVGAFRSGVSVGSADEPDTPQRSLRDDRVLAAISGGSSAAITAVVATMIGGLTHDPWAVAVLCASVGVACAGRTAYYRYLVAKLWLWLRCKVSLNLLAVLELAVAEGLLYRRGGVYVFQHNVVQDGLAARRGEEPELVRGVDAIAAEAVADIREDLVERAFKLADVQAVVETERIDEFKAHISGLVDTWRSTLVPLTALARERFVAAKSRYTKAAVGAWPLRATTTYGVLALMIFGADATTSLLTVGSLSWSLSTEQFLKGLSGIVVLFVCGAIACVVMMEEQSPAALRAMGLIIERLASPRRSGFWPEVSALWRMSRRLRPDVPGISLGIAAATFGVLIVLYLHGLSPGMLPAVTSAVMSAGGIVGCALAMAWAATPGFRQSRVGPFGRRTGTALWLIM